MNLRLIWIGAGLAIVPSSAHAANVALEAPVEAVCRQPNESYSVIQALLEERGHTVTIVAGNEIDTLDEIQQFDTIVLSGSGYNTGHDVTVFDAVLPDYIEQGGGLVITGWVYYYNGVGVAPGFNEVAPFEPSTNYLEAGLIDLTPGHEIVEGLADWNNPSFDAYSGAMKPGAIELSRNGGTIDGGVWEVGGGRVASLGPLFTAEYQAYATQTLHDGSLPDATEMFMRAIEWTATENAPEGCHDGDLDPGEECDDGNFSNSDACVNPCVFASCGDGYTYAGVELCDDGDGDNTDGCLIGCIPASCGDGFVRTGVEGCDDGNDGDNTDECIDNCVLASCGDGYLYAGVEACDDGNLNNADACPGSCQPAVCGDGYVLAGVEPCDDGNDIGDDDCLVGCILPSCGDGFVQPGVEACDDNNKDNTDTCVGDACTLASCGDGYVFAGFEECDDGNMTANDGCTACQNDSVESSSEGGGSSSESGDPTGSAEGTETGVNTTGDEEDTTGQSSLTADPGTSGGTTSGDPSDGWTGPIDPTVIDGSEESGAPGQADPTSGCACRNADAPTRGGDLLWLVALVAKLGARRRQSPAA